MDIKQKVQDLLKPQVSSFGFSKEEVKSIATQIADNLTISEEATEEEVNEAIKNGINSVIPFLKVGQQMATRVINVAKKQHQEELEAEKKHSAEAAQEAAAEAAKKATAKAEEATKAAKEALAAPIEETAKPNPVASPIEEKPTSLKPSNDNPTTTSEPPAWAKQLIEQNRALAEQNAALAEQGKRLAEQSKLFQEQSKVLSNEIAAMKGEKTLSLRTAKLEELLKDTGTFGKRTLKTFSKMSFKDDAAFDDFYKDVEDDLKEYNQERINAGLDKLGAPTVGVAPVVDKKEVLSDAEVDALAEKF